MNYHNYLKLFLLYLEYAEVDLANSLINKTKFARNVRILDYFKNVFLYSLNPEYDGSKILDEIQIAINEYKNQCNQLINLEKQKQQFENLNNQEIITETINQSIFRTICRDYYKSNQHFSSAFTNQMINKQKFKDLLDYCYEDKKEYIFVQSLLEFNNAISHLCIAFTDDKNRESNIQSAISHLYRATIDNYKIIIRFTMQDINNENIIESFISIRQEEFLLLGENLMNKKISFYNPIENKINNTPIIQAYKILYETITK